MEIDFDLLLEEMLEEILSRLPVKSLLTFRCVSKSWRSLIDSKQFINAHVQNSTRKTNNANHSGILFFSCNIPHQVKVSECFRPSFSHPLNSCAFELGFLSKVPRYSSISFVGYCDGLVCILLRADKDRNEFILWNPCIRIFRKLPDMNDNVVGFKRMCFGFGYDESSDDYKVVVIFRVENGNQPICKVYSLKMDFWKEINGRDINSYWCHYGLLASGKLHWGLSKFTLSSQHPFDWEIVAFDLKTETFNIVEQPCYPDGPCSMLSLGMVGEFLAVDFIHKNKCIDIWAMKEYGVKESWERVIFIPDSRFNMLIAPYMPPVFIRREGAILLMGMGIYSYHLELVYDSKNKLRYIPTKDSVLYAGSLVSPLEVSRKPN